MLEKIKLANEQITKVKDYVVKNSDALDYMNLKLHDAQSYKWSKDAEEKFPLLFNTDELDDLFDAFCEDSYDIFIEDLMECHGIDFKSMKNQLGRTSSFYLHDRDLFYRGTNCNRGDFDNYIGQIMNEFYGYNIGIEDFMNDNETINSDKLMNNKEVDKSIIDEELDYIINDMYNDIEKYLNDIITVYEIIKNFKANQVEYFKEFLEYYEEELQEEDLQELKELTEYKNKLNDIFNKIRYIITDEEINYLKKHLTK